jgi:hypothetical protein
MNAMHTSVSSIFVTSIPGILHSRTLSFRHFGSDSASSKFRIALQAIVDSGMFLRTKASLLTCSFSFYIVVVHSLMAKLFFLLFGPAVASASDDFRSSVVVPEININYLHDRWYSPGHAFSFQCLCLAMDSDATL